MTLLLLGGNIESNLVHVPPNPNQPLADISKMNDFIILGHKLMSNMVHKPLNPH